MTLPAIEITALHSHAYQTLRDNILSASKLDANTLDSVSYELAYDLEGYPFFQAKDPESRKRIVNDYEAFHAMMHDAFGNAEWQENCGAAVRGLQQYQYYLAWAWTENERTRNCLLGAPTYFTKEDAIKSGLVHSLNAQRAYLRAMAILLL